MVIHTNEQVILALQDRRCALDQDRVNAIAHLHAILGGLAELDLLIATYQAQGQAAELAPEQAEQSDGG